MILVLDFRHWQNGYRGPDLVTCRPRSAVSWRRRRNGFRIVRACKCKATTDSNHHFNIAPNVLERNFQADQPNVKWAGDITYIWTAEGWLYLAVTIERHSRRVVGWAVSCTLFQYINPCLTGDVHMAEKGLLQHPSQTLRNRKYITRQVRTIISLNENRMQS
jgi:hypothetical protein